MRPNKKGEAPDEGREATGDLTRFLEAEIWPRIPPKELDRPSMSRAERERILGLGQEGR